MPLAGTPRPVADVSRLPYVRQSTTTSAKLCAMDQRKRKPGSGQKPAPARDMLLDHLPLVLTGLAFTFVFVRLFVISHGNVQTVRAMLNAAGTVEVVFGTLLGALPLIGLTLLLVPSMYLGPHRSRLARVYAGTAIGFGLLLTGLTGPTLSILLGLALVAIILAFQWSIYLLSDRRPVGSLGIVVAMLVVLGVDIATADQPWLPAERITVTGRDSMVGYVLGLEDHDLVILRDSDRLVMRIRVSEVESRQICQPKGQRDPALAWKRHGRYPDC
jgi:hypothetical protein